MAGQMRRIHEEANDVNEVFNFSFYSQKEGYTAFSNGIAFTQDSGRTYTSKYITLDNVDFGDYYVNLVPGFLTYGCRAFSRDTLIAYGSYGLVPAILYSVDQGNTYKLIFYSLYDPNELGPAVVDMVFPQKSNIGYAIDPNRILKTTNKGVTWTPIFSVSSGFRKLFFINDYIGFVVKDNQIIRTDDGGLTWRLLNMPSTGEVEALYFFDQNKGYVSQVNDNWEAHSYFTSNGGTSWQLKSTDEFNYAFNQTIHFINDSTAYQAGSEFQILKTTDSTKHWEPLERDNNYTYLGYSHNTLFFWDNNEFWAGGGHGFCELTTNAGGNSLPLAHFKIDATQLNVNNTVNLVNYSKQGSEYSFKWFKNSIQIASSYNTSYISDRLGIDTIQLVAIKGTRTDTATLYLDTRPIQPPCNAGFTFTVDTSTVKFASSSTNPSTRHYWYFDDGTSDTTSVNPTHQFASPGGHVVKHKVFNVISGCKDSVTQNVGIVRTQNCLIPTFTFTYDTFYTNQYKFTGFLAQLTESSGDADQKYYWSFGDGRIDSSTRSPKHTFDSARYYNVKLSIKNKYTGCISTITKPVLVQLQNGCNASFKIHPPEDSLGYFLPLYESVHFNGVPNVTNKGKRNTWIINGWDSTSTGNQNQLIKTFYTLVLSEAQYFEDPVFSGCYQNATKEYCVDSSLNKTMKHVFYDSLTNCTEEVVRSFTIPTVRKTTVVVRPDPAFPNFARLGAYRYKVSPTSDTTPFSTRWRISGPGDNFYFNGYDIWTLYPGYVFKSAGNWTVGAGCKECDPSGYRQVYWVHYNVAKSVGPCDFYPVSFTYTRNSSDTNTYTFHIGSDCFFVNDASLDYRHVWYFGDGDSSTALFDFDYTFRTPSPHNVTLKYLAPAGCTKDTTISVTAVCSQPTPVITLNGGVLFSSGSQGNQWYLDNVAIPGAVQSSYSPTQSGSYTVRTTVNGCTSAMSQPFSYIITGINDPFVQGSIKIFPNPVTNLLNVQNNELKKLEIKIFNSVGVEISKQLTSKKENTFNMLPLSPGAYLISVTEVRTLKRLQKLVIKL